MQYIDAETGFTYQFDLERGQDFGTFYVKRADGSTILTVPGTPHMWSPNGRTIKSVGQYYAKQLKGKK